jgi:hypothetical protein
MYECTRCGYNTSRKHNLVAHLQRQLVCLPTKSDIDVKIQLLELTKRENKFKCNYCDEYLGSLSTKYRHQTNCHVKKEKEHILELEDRIKKLETFIANNNISNVNNITINNTTNNITNINIKTFGYENLAYIEANKDLLNTCFLTKNIKLLIESIHCDKNHPENHNVRIKNKKEELMETFVDEKWIISDCEDTLTDLIQKGYRILKLYSHANKKNLISECDEDEYFEIKDWLETIYDDTKLQKPIKKQLMILFMNNKTLLLGKE